VGILRLRPLRKAALVWAIAFIQRILNPRDAVKTKNLSVSRGTLLLLSLDPLLRVGILRLRPLRKAALVWAIVFTLYLSNFVLPRQA
jgi:hypothetical protein